jgi:PAS domain S-box-containing protein
LYTEEDVERVAAVTRLVADGLTLSAAVGRVTSAGTGGVAATEIDAQLLQQVMQAVHHGVWVCQSGRTRYANPRMAELMRCAVDELMARSMLDFVASHEAERIRERGQRVREGHRERYETWLHRTDGTVFRAEVDASPLRDAVGSYKGAVALISEAAPH